MDLEDGIMMRRDFSEAREFVYGSLRNHRRLELERRRIELIIGTCSLGAK